MVIIFFFILLHDGTTLADNQVNRQKNDNKKWVIMRRKIK